MSAQSGWLASLLNTCGDTVFKFFFWGGDQLYLAEAYRGIAESLQTNATVEPEIKPRSVLPSPLLFKNSSIILSINV
jgi:hypothetical protein